MIRLKYVALTTALLIAALTATLAEPPRHDFPPVGCWQVLCGDFHMHTINSDGKLTTRERVEESYNLGYDVIAITDHGKPGSYRVAKYVAEPLGLLVLPGFETGVLGKEHYVALGVPATFKPRDPHKLSEKPGDKTVYYRDEMLAIAEAGGILFQAHPPNEWRDPTDWGVREGIIVGVEIQNGYGKVEEGSGPLGGVHCYPHSFDWALKHNLALFANTDIHPARKQGQQPVTLVFVAERTPAGVMDAIRARRTVAWFNNVVCGREELLTKLVEACVLVKPSGSTQLAFENRSPIAFRVALAGSTVEVPPYGNAVCEWTGGNSATLKWLNVWTSPTSNLETEIKIGELAAAATSK
ncbi:MAG: hypothetical protein QHI38_04790 [Armatimonadota bacterium]|nr:hypothetical protein [Armatimonadota bacterium]